MILAGLPNAEIARLRNRLRIFRMNPAVQLVDRIADLGLCLADDALPLVGISNPVCQEIPVP